MVIAAGWRNLQDVNRGDLCIYPVTQGGSDV